MWNSRKISSWVRWCLCLFHTIKTIYLYYLLYNKVLLKVRFGHKESFYLFIATPSSPPSKKIHISRPYLRAAKLKKKNERTNSVED